MKSLEHSLRNIALMKNSKPKILALTEGGEPTRFITYEKAAYYHCKGLIAWDAGNYFININGGISRMTGEHTIVHINSIIAIKNDKRHPRQTVSYNKEILFNRDLFTCGYCNQQFKPSKLTRDHIVPKYLGGDDTWSNLISSCKPCNNYKGHKLLSSLNMDLQFPPYEIYRNEAIIYRNKKLMLSDQYEYLTRQIPPDSRVHDLTIKFADTQLEK